MPPIDDLSPGYVLWGNLEVGGEYWSAGGFALRYFFGYGSLLTPGGLKCPPDVFDCGPDSRGLKIPYGGIGLGYAF